MALGSPPRTQDPFREMDRSAIFALRSTLESALEGKPGVVELCIIALLASGHILLEDVPGVGKTTLARALASAVGGEMKRVQFTNDLLPSDILGVSIYSKQRESFQINKGPIFSNVLLADEINRANPRTQSALLEAMNEEQVSLDGHTLTLPKPFFVLATQNPQDFAGTFPLPESQLDRFLFRLSIGYPSAGVELRLITGNEFIRKRTASTVLTPEQLLLLQERVRHIKLNPELASYLLSIVVATRNSPLIALGASTRAAIAYALAARARAFLHGRSYCIPDDIQALAVPALAHRLRLRVSETGYNPSREEVEHLVRELTSRVPIPL